MRKRGEERVRDQEGERDIVEEERERKKIAAPKSLITYMPTVTVQ